DEDDQRLHPTHRPQPPGPDVHSLRQLSARNEHSRSKIDEISNDRTVAGGVLLSRNDSMAVEII
ncbi:MAG: hypothetical protein K8F58_17415, partial [Bauldia sp.]|nr:hypothetical protein [Bauldia sp.]